VSNPLHGIRNPQYGVKKYFFGKKLEVNIFINNFVEKKKR